MKKEIKTVPALFPMPVILIATYNEDGSIDVMNAAWGCAYDFSQIKLNISSTHKTYKNIIRNKAFSVTLGDAKHVIESDYFGIVSANNTKDKFEKTGLKAHKSEKVNAPILDDFPICMECKPEIIDEEYGVIGNIVRLSVDEEYVDEKGRVDISKMGIIAYDPFNHGYYVVKDKVGQAFHDGLKLK